uniref:NADH-ubiquinone oxidoreductase chain 4L n=1 Tax=Montfortula punctata TaxID=1906930 RepID=A0A1J0CYH4_9VEST|nr:NADH dehydrogenase subunit 4L [Montfortula punctata]
MDSIAFFCSLITVCAIMSIISVFLQYKHLLMVLINLEVLLLALFILTLMHSWSSFESHACLILITMGVCEASLGLATLVTLIRTHGNDYVHSMSVHKC